ncbi:MAG: O-antigen ligase family protein [Caldilineaceae bacterium]
MSLLMFWPVHWLLQRTMQNVERVSRLIYLLLFWLPINLTVSIASAISWEAAGYLLLGVTLYTLCVTQLWATKNPTILAWGLLGLSFLLVISAPPMVSWKSEFRLFYVPFYDWFQGLPASLQNAIHANIFAGALVPLLALTMALALPKPKQGWHLRYHQSADSEKAVVLRFHEHRSEKIQRLVAALLVILIVSMLLLTQSRSGYLGGAVAIALVILLRWPRLCYTLPVVAIAIGVLIYQTGFWYFVDLMGADNTFGGAEWRLPIWRVGWQALQDFAWTGIGIGSFRQTLTLLYPNTVLNSISANHAHNLLLQIGLDLGLPGLSAYVLLLASMISMTITVLFRMRSPQRLATAVGATYDGHSIVAPSTVGVTISTKRFIRQLGRLERTRQQHWALAAGCLAALVGMQVHGLLDAVTWGNKLAFLPWLIFAQITLLYRYHTAPPRREEK